MRKRLDRPPRDVPRGSPGRDRMKGINCSTNICESERVSRWKVPQNQACPGRICVVGLHEWGGLDAPVRGFERILNPIRSHSQSSWLCSCHFHLQLHCSYNVHFADHEWRRAKGQRFPLASLLRAGNRLPTTRRLGIAIRGRCKIRLSARQG